MLKNVGDRDREEDLRGQVPDKAATALLLIDVINDLEFEGGAQILKPASRMAAELVKLKRAAELTGIPAIYVNDNFGHWQSNFDLLIEQYLASDVRGGEIIRRLIPTRQDYHVLKPSSSGFYATPLEVLLQHLRARRLIITGLTTDQCVMFTAIDAYTRGYELVVPCDGAAAIRREDHDSAIQYIGRVLKADVRHWQESTLANVRGRQSSQGLTH